MPTKPRFKWSATSRRYIDTRSGRFVAAGKVRGALDVAIRKSNREITALATQLRKGEITAQQWSLAMRQQIKAQQLASAAAARGGFAQMSPADYGRVGGQVARQYRYLNKFTKQITKGLPLDGKFMARAKLYGEAARGTYEKTARDVADESGAIEEKNILHPADHCAECMGLSAQGWQPIGSMPAPGQRQCGNNCHCTMAYR